MCVCGGGGGTALRCLNTVCARSTICTADVNKHAYKALKKTNKHGASIAIILFCLMKNV